jgi:hypothetical protein
MALRIIGTQAQSVVFNGHVETEDDLFGYNFANQPLGDPHHSRVVVVGLANYATKTGSDISGVKIQGIAATRQIKSAYPYPRAEIWSAEVPTGTTGTIYMSVGTGGIGMKVAIWSLYGLFQKVTPYNTAQLNQSSGGQISLSVPSQKGIAIVFGVQRTSTGLARGITWGYPEIDMNPTVDFVGESGSVSGVSRANLPETSIFTVEATPLTGVVTIVGTTWR